MSAPAWLLQAINATELKDVPTSPNRSWEQSNTMETPIHKDFIWNVPTAPSVPTEIKPLSNKIVDIQRERRREKVLSLLKGKRFALYVNDDMADPVIATVGIQNIATFELEIPRHSYDYTVLLDLIEKHYGTDGSCQ